MSKEFIKMISEFQTERFNVHITDLANKKTPCGIFFGFEVVPSNVVANIKWLSDRKINLSFVIVRTDEQIIALKNFVDVPVITLEDIPRFVDEYSSVKLQEIFIRIFQDLPFAPYFIRQDMEVFTYSDDGQFLFMMKHLPELYNVYEMLGSDESKKVFCAAIKGRLTAKVSDYRFAPETQYFLEGFTPSAGDIAIDGGAYDGGTAIAFAKCGAKVFAFEMDAVNYKKCMARLERFGGGIILFLKISA